MAAAVVIDSIAPFPFHESDLDPSRRVALERLKAIVRRNAEHVGPPVQHVLLHGQNGSGKTTILRLLEQELNKPSFSSRVSCHYASDLATRTASPETILHWATAAIEGRVPDTTSFPWRGGDEEAWEAAIRALDAALDVRFGEGRGLVVILLDDFELILQRVFGARDAELRLRRLLQDHGRIMIVGASWDRGVQNDYDRPLFQVFESIELPPFDLLKAMRHNRDIPIDPKRVANLYALFVLLGSGQPRRLELAANLSLHETSAQVMFLRLRELEATSFEQTVANLAVRPARLLDALLAGGEPARPATLAERLGTLQNDIAPTLRDLLATGLIRKRPGSGGKVTFYEVQDRLFADWYVARRSHRPTESIAAIGAELLATWTTWKQNISPSGTFIAAYDNFRTQIRTEKRSVVFHNFATDFDWRLQNHSSSQHGEAETAALIALITEAVAPELLWDIANTLQDRMGRTAYASLLHAAALIPFADPRLETAVKRLPLGKDQAAHPDAQATVIAIRGERQPEQSELS